MSARQGNRIGVDALSGTRQEIHDLLTAAKAPVKAYELIALLGAKRGRQVSPPTVYRALNALRDAGLVHQIAGLDAFALCDWPGIEHEPCFLICNGCGQASEHLLETLNDELQSLAGDRSFAIAGAAVEARGRCADCLEA